MLEPFPTVVIGAQQPIAADVLVDARPDGAECALELRVGDVQGEIVDWPT
jgi:hypothetical protein